MKVLESIPKMALVKMKNSRMEGLWNKNKTMKAKAKILFIGTIS
jgi:hypothetical protein